MKKLAVAVKTIPRTASENKERRAKRLEREALKASRRKTTPRGTERKKRRRDLQALYQQRSREDLYR